MELSDYSRFIALSRYARWLPEEQRRETWPETVKRYFDFFEKHLAEKHRFDLRIIRGELEDAVLKLEVMPSMRALMTAGPALERSNIAGYNCAYVAVDDVSSFSEAMYILLNGAGVGYSVESRYVNNLPSVPYYKDEYGHIQVEDSKEGWAASFHKLLEYLYRGYVPSVDYSLIRPAGARLKTFGGRASGPGPLIDLFQFTINTFMDAQGRKLRPIEVHDIMCKVGEVVVVGGVRRSAMISLSDLSDNDLAFAKSGTWWDHASYRALANNSAVFEDKPSLDAFLGHWIALYQSGSGERGIFNRDASRRAVERIGRRDANHEWGTNPCSEIILRSAQFCNLSEVVIRPEDDAVALRRKVRLATWLGTIQATLTDFPFLRDMWRENTEEERLLGVSLTGIMDNRMTSGIDEWRRAELAALLVDLKNTARTANAGLAQMIGIEPAAAITCVKPSGTVSQLVDSASGIHPRHSPFYLRTVRGDNKDPMTQFLIAEGIPHEPCVMKPDTTTVFTFPQRAPIGVPTRGDLTAVEHLEIWRLYQTYWCEHKPSVTISVKPHEWLEVGSWVYKHFNEVSGVSFLPYSEHTYQQAPYQECDEATYYEWRHKMPLKIGWHRLARLEHEDNTASSQTLACTGGVCEIVNIGDN